MGVPCQCQVILSCQSVHDKRTDRWWFWYVHQWSLIGCGWCVVLLIQLTPEVEVWDKLLSEICRQVRIECSERGMLLLSAVTRQKQMLQAALATCDSMFQLSLASREALQQQEEQVQSLQQLLASAEQRQQQLQVNVTPDSG